MTRIYFFTFLTFLLLVFTTKVPDRVVFLDIGVGDASLIQYGGLSVLIDGGPDDNLLYKLDKYFSGTRPFLDILVITHLHADHFSGFTELVERYEIGEIWIPDYCTGSHSPKYLVDPHTNVLIKMAGDFFTFDAMRIDVLSPQREDGCISSNIKSSMNNSSLVLKVTSPEVTILLMGDAEREVEGILLRKQGIELSSQILKAGHHCSSTSSSARFIEAVKPTIVICSTGEDNSYGHPSTSVINLFEELGIAYLVTYEEGDIEIDL